MPVICDINEANLRRARDLVAKERGARPEGNHADEAAAQVGGIGLIAGRLGEVLQGGQQQVFLGGPAAVEGRLADRRPPGDPVQGESGPADFAVHGQGGGEDPSFDAGVGGASPPGRSVRFRPHAPECVIPSGCSGWAGA